MTRELITEKWLAEVNFKCRQEDRQPNKHWTIWFGWGHKDSNMCIDDLGIELTRSGWPNHNGDYVGNPDLWMCWVVSQRGSRKFIFIRGFVYQDEIIDLIKALTGQEWKPENHMYGNIYHQEMANYLRVESERISKSVDDLTRSNTALKES